MTETYTAHTAADIVEALPTLFGFTPSESFIGIVTGGPRHRFGFRLRLDIPEFGHYEQAGAMIAGHLNDYADTGVVLIALTEDHDAADAMMNAVLDRLRPVQAVVALSADVGHVRAYDADGSIDYTDPGTLRNTGTVSEAVVQAIAARQQVWASREALAAQFTPAPTLHGIAAEADSLGAAAVEKIALAATAALETSSRAAVSDDDARALAIAAQIIPVRDAIWSAITAETAENDAEIWRLVAIKTAGRAAAGPYALAAFGYWLAGDGARSLIAVDQALHADAHHSMADLVRSVVSLGINPKTWKGITG